MTSGFRAFASVTRAARSNGGVQLRQLRTISITSGRGAIGAKRRRPAARARSADSRRELDHLEHRPRGAGADLLGDGDALGGRLVAQRAVDALEIGRLHVAAEAARLVELLLGVVELEPHDQATL